jgi:hypothetical protein
MKTPMGFPLPTGTAVKIEEIVSGVERGVPYYQYNLVATDIPLPENYRAFTEDAQGVAIIPASGFHEDEFIYWIKPQKPRLVGSFTNDPMERTPIACRSRSLRATEENYHKLLLRITDGEIPFYKQTNDRIAQVEYA